MWGEGRCCGRLFEGCLGLLMWRMDDFGGGAVRVVR